tara:strand:- start:939 stop:1769 length:831 start_codon:yes stop_codon:yes gene_type:complete
MDKIDKKSLNLLNAEGYNKELNKEIYYKGLSLYIGIGIQCVRYLLNNLKTSNKDYIIFIVDRGLKTIKHVFKFLIMYTKNIDLLEHHLEKAYLYYVEFVSQIGEDANSYIKLNSKDATLFVYKKTIYDINNDYRNKIKLYEKDKIYLNKISNFVEIYNNILFNKTIIIIKNTENTEEIIKSFNKNNKEFDKIISNVYNIFIKSDYVNFTKVLMDILYELMNNNMKIERYLKILTLLTNKYKKKEIKHEKINKKLYDDKNDKKMNMSELKYINWLYS